MELFQRKQPFSCLFFFVPFVYSNYERFNCNNIRIRFFSWSYRGCWHQTFPLELLSFGLLVLTHSNCHTFKRTASSCPFTASPCRDWAISAPAAPLGAIGRFSGRFSGVEPNFSATRRGHGSPTRHHPTDRAEFRSAHRSVRTHPSRPHAPLSFTTNRFALLPRVTAGDWFFSRAGLGDLVSAALLQQSGPRACISFRITGVVHVIFFIAE